MNYTVKFYCISVSAAVSDAVYTFKMCALFPITLNNKFFPCDCNVCALMTLLNEGHEPLPTA